MSKEEIEEQITRCKEMQRGCRIDDIDAFLRLSKRIEELVALLDEFEKRKVELQSFDSAKSKNNETEYF